MNINNSFETGAITHVVNELILYTDTTMRLAEMRDNIYMRYNAKRKKYQTFMSALANLFKKVVENYLIEFKEDSYHIKNLGNKERLEFITLYANRFESWQKETQRILNN